MRDESYHCRMACIQLTCVFALAATLINMAMTGHNVLAWLPVLGLTALANLFLALEHIKDLRRLRAKRWDCQGNVMPIPPQGGSSTAPAKTGKPPQGGSVMCPPPNTYEG